MKRAKLSKRTSRSLFRNHTKIHYKNVHQYPMRGGIRL